MIAVFDPGDPYLPREMIVISQNLNPYVLMMQPTQNWYRCDRTELLPSPKIG
jgi:hypothetical protein